MRESVNKNKGILKTISIFGSTGSIGKQTIDVIKANRDLYDVVALTANNNVDLLIKQAKTVRPKYAIILSDELYFKLEKKLEGYNIKTLSGEQALLEVAAIKCDIFVSAIVGSSALKPTFQAIKAGSNIALANKESLVTAGNILIREAKKSDIKIIPVDSEHNAIFQCLDGKSLDKVDSVVLTASGGPFKNFTVEQMRDIQPEQAIKHPNWLMGKKISVDSATMMNKGLELMEAYYLFGLASEQIDAIVHPESIIHGLVNYNDGTTLAMLAEPDMRVPINFAINYPERIKLEHKKLKLEEISNLTFEKIDNKRFPAVQLCKDVLAEGGCMPCLLGIANEVAVESFLNHEIGFLDILFVVFDTLQKAFKHDFETIEDVLFCYDRMIETTKEVLLKYKK